MKRVRGTACTDPRIGAPEIRLATRLFGDLAALEQTVLHEAAHVAVGSHHSHDSEWRKKAEQFGCKVPANRYRRSTKDVRVFCSKCGEIGWMTHSRFVHGMNVRARGYSFMHSCGGDILKHADQG